MPEFPHITIRTTPAGRQAYVEGTRVAVWRVVQIVAGLGGDAEKAACHLDWPLSRVQAALAYAVAFPQEIDAALADNASFDYATVVRRIPRAELFLVEPSSDQHEAGAGAAPTASG